MRTDKLALCQKAPDKVKFFEVKIQKIGALPESSG